MSGVASDETGTDLSYLYFEGRVICKEKHYNISGEHYIKNIIIMGINGTKSVQSV